MGNKSRFKKLSRKDWKRVKSEQTRRMQEKRQLRKAEGGVCVAPTTEPAEQHVSDDVNMEPTRDDRDHDSEEELCIQIKEEVDQAIPVEFLASTSEMPLQTPQFNISVAPSVVDSQEPAYSISINEIQDPLSQDTTSTMPINLYPLPFDSAKLLPQESVLTTPSDLLIPIDQHNDGKPRGKPKKPDTSTKQNNVSKGKKREKDANKVTVVKRNPPRLAKTMTYAQECMDRKLKDIMQSQKKILNILNEMPNVAAEEMESVAVKENGTNPSSKEDRFDICGRHIASLLRELPTFDALALEAKLMDIVYKEREKLETFRKSLQSYSAVMLPHKN